MANTRTQTASRGRSVQIEEAPRDLPSNRSLTVVKSSAGPVPEFRREIPYPSKVYRFEKICDVVAETLEVAVKSSPELSRHPLWGIKVWFIDGHSSIELYPLVQSYETGWFGFGRTKEVFSELPEIVKIEIPHEHGEDCKYESCPCTCGREEAHALSSEFENPEIQQAFLSALDSSRKKELLKYAIDTHTYKDARTGKRQKDQFKR